ncbi:MAG: T9SS type A sorting domain-containing protein [Cyclobacteriaceae bacterium]
MKKTLLLLLITQLSLASFAQLTRKFGYTYSSTGGYETTQFNYILNVNDESGNGFTFKDGGNLYVYNSDFTLYDSYSSIDLGSYIGIDRDFWDTDDDIEIQVEKYHGSYGATSYVDSLDTISVYDHNLNLLHEITGYIDETTWDVVDNELLFIISYKNKNIDEAKDSTVFYKIRDVITSSSKSIARVDQNKLSAYPNPAARSSHVNVRYEFPENETTGSLVFYTLGGNKLKEVRVGRHVSEVKISTNGLPKGMCVYKLVTSSGIVYSNKLMIH